MFHQLENWDLPRLATQGACAIGLLYVGYKIGSSQKNRGKRQINVAKSFIDGDNDPVKTYTIRHSTPMNYVQKRLIEETIQHERSIMMGAPEVVNLNAALIKALRAKKVIDVGVFTGASSLAAALALPPNGKVIACDVSEDFTSVARKYWDEAGVASKIDLRIAPAGRLFIAEFGFKRGLVCVKYVFACLKIGYESGCRVTRVGVLVKKCRHLAFWG